MYVCVCMHDRQQERMTVGLRAHARVRFAVLVRACVCVWGEWYMLHMCACICMCVFEQGGVSSLLATPFAVAVPL